MAVLHGTKSVMDTAFLYRVATVTMASAIGAAGTDGWEVSADRADSSKASPFILTKSSTLSTSYG